MALDHLTGIKVALIVTDGFLSEILLNYLRGLIDGNLRTRLRNELVQINKFLQAERFIDEDE